MTGGIGDCSGLLGLAGWFCLWMMQCWKRHWLMGWCSRKKREVVGVGMIAGAGETFVSCMTGWR